MNGNREAAEVARKAAEIIQQRGKATGTPLDASRRVCTHMALRLASAGAIDVGDRVLDRVRDHVGEFRIGKWSDLPTTTEAVIAKVFLQVADDLEVAP